MAWTADKAAYGFSSGLVWARVVYANGTLTFEETYRTRTIAAGWPDSVVRERVDELNSLDLSVLKTGPPDPKPVVVAVPPTQDEIDLQNWLVLYRDWQDKNAILGVSKTVTQQQVDAALAAWKAAFKDQYARFLI